MRPYGEVTGNAELRMGGSHLSARYRRAKRKAEIAARKRAPKKAERRRAAREIERQR